MSVTEVAEEPMKPVYTIRLWPESTRGLWLGELYDCLDKYTACAEAENVGTVLAMLREALIVWGDCDD